MSESIALQHFRKKQSARRWVVLLTPLLLAAWISPPILIWMFLPEKPEYAPVKLILVLSWFVSTAAAARALFWPSKQTDPLDPVQTILQIHYGGVFKRIDENRELLELIQEKAPEFLSENPWVEGWLKSQDGFLVDLAETVPADAKLPRCNAMAPDAIYKGSSPYPRPWPGDRRRD